jgi:hypothetical protein
LKNQSIIVKKMISKSVSKKINKLIKDPNLFFLDFFAKRIQKNNPSWGSSLIELPQNTKESSPNAKASAKLKIDGEKNKKHHFLAETIKVKNLVNNNIADKAYVIDELVKFLLTTTCFIQTVESPNPNSHRIIAKGSDLTYILKQIESFECDGIKVVASVKSPHHGFRDLIYCCLYDEIYVYSGNLIEVDPWVHAGGRVFTTNKNNYITHIDERHLNKTVYAPHPYFLQGKENNVSLVNALNLPCSLYEVPDFPVDVVYTWVDGSDPDWRKKKKEYHNTGAHQEDVSNARYDQIDEIRYSLRSIAAYFKEVRNIYIVTDKQIPWWLNKENSKIQIVDHADIFENPKHLPSFNSHAIEANLYRIPGLSEHFIYMNDDVFLWRPMKKTDFFSPNGLSLSRLENINNVYGQPSDEFPGWKNAALNSNTCIEDLFGKRAYSYHEHSPHALRKSILKDLFKSFPAHYERTSSARFRTKGDISSVSFFYHAYAFARAAAICTQSSCITLNSANANHIERLSRLVLSEGVDFVCLNDGGDSRVKKDVLKLLGQKFPIPVDWESA